jgi:hypothetical protein
MSQLEERLQHIESNIEQLQQCSGNSTSDKDMQGHHSYLPTQVGAYGQSSDISLGLPNYVDQSAAEMGEPDTAEDSIDGMGAMKFEDEEDCGYFGTCSNFAVSAWCVDAN